MASGFLLSNSLYILGQSRHNSASPPCWNQMSPRHLSNNILRPQFNQTSNVLSYRYLSGEIGVCSTRDDNASSGVKDDGSPKPKNWVEPNFFYDEQAGRSRPVFTLHVGSDGSIGGAYSGLDGQPSALVEIRRKETLDLMAEELYALIKEYPAEGFVIGISCDKEVAQFVEDYAHSLFTTMKLQDVKYTFFNLSW